MVFFMLFLALRLLIPDAAAPLDAFARDESDTPGTHP